MAIFLTNYVLFLGKWGYYINCVVSKEILRFYLEDKYSVHSTIKWYFTKWWLPEVKIQVVVSPSEFKKYKLMPINVK